MTRTVSIRISGKVQGVWFRASTKSVARDLQLSGFVRNMPDGSVYLEASGPDGQIEQLITWCRRGPELARVESVDVHELPKADLPMPFEVRRQS